MNNASLKHRLGTNDRNLRVTQSVKIRGRQRNPRGKDKGRMKKSHDPTWTPPYYLLRKCQESIADFSGTVASTETSHEACEEKDTQSRDEAKSTSRCTEQQAMSRVFTKILSPAVIITRDKLPTIGSSNFATAGQFFVCKAKTGTLMKGADSAETISRRKDGQDIERMDLVLKERKAARDEANESSTRRDVVRYEEARKRKRNEKKEKTTVATEGSERASNTFAEEILRIDPAALIGATSDNPIQDEAVPFGSYEKGVECNESKVMDARNCTDARTSFNLKGIHKNCLKESGAADVYSEITCSLPGSLPNESLRMIDSGRLNSSLATALRDRSTCIPVQPNRSLPLRPVPPMPIPTRNAMVKLPKDSPILKLAHMNPLQSSDHANRSEGEPKVIHSSRDQSAEQEHLFESQNESDNFSEGLRGRVQRKIGNLEGELVKNNRKKRKESLEHPNAGEHVIKENRSDNRSSNDVKEFLIGNYSNKEKIPPLKLKKILHENTEKADHLARERKVEEMTNYRIVSGSTPAPISPSWNIPFPGLEIDFSSVTLHIREGNVSQVDLTVASQNSTNVEDKADNCGKLNFVCGADESSATQVQANAIIENSIRNETSSTITHERNNNREMITMQKQHNHYNVEQIIPKCPTSVPISVAKRHKVSAKATVKPKPLTSKMPVTKNNQENACNLPSMPILELEFEEYQSQVKVQSTTHVTNGREIVSDDCSASGNVKAAGNESLPKVNFKESNENDSPVYVEDLLLDSSSLGSTSTLSLSPRTQEGANELQRSNEQETQEPGDKNSGIITKENCRRFEENKMQESLKQRIRIQAMEAARYQKRIAAKATYAREEATEHSGTMYSDESCCMEQDQEQEQEQLYDSRYSSTDSTSIVRRSVEEQLQCRRTKLRIMLQELKIQTALLKKQMESVSDSFQRGRVQQMINCTEKQAENLTKQLNKLSGEMDTKSRKEDKVQRIPQQNPPSPEPPKLSPKLPLNYSRESPSQLRNSPPVLPRAGLPLVSETCDPASRSTRRSPSVSAGSPLKANGISETLRGDATVPACLANTTSDGLLVDTERLRALNTLMTLVERIPSISDNPQQAASESNFSSQRPVPVDETRSLPGKSMGNMHGEQSAASRYTGDVTSLQTSCNAPGSCAQIENPGGANVYRNANEFVEANSAQANAVPSGPFARTSAAFDNTAQPIEYGRTANAGNMPMNNNVTMLPVKSNFNINGTFYQNFGPQDCSVATRTALPQQAPSKITQASAAVGPTNLPAASHCSRASVSSMPAGQPYRVQQLNKRMDNGKVRSTKRSKGDASQKDSSQRTNRRIMSENFPTLANWVAQMSQQQIPPKSAVKTPSNPTKVSSIDTAPAATTLEAPSNFRVPGSDMYKMTATAVDMPTNIKLNNVNTRWKTNRWEENSIAFQEGFRPAGAAQLYQNNFIGYPYGTTFGYHPLYGYRTFPYPPLHSGSVNPHQAMADSLNMRLGQNTERLTNLQGTEQFTTEMMKHQIMAAAFPSQNVNSEYIQQLVMGQSLGPNRSVLHPNSQNEQFRIPNAPAIQQRNENSYWLAGQNGLPRFSNNEMNQLNNCMAASQMKRNYEAVLLENRNSQIPQTGSTSAPNFPSSKEQSAAIDSSMSSKSLLMHLTKEVMNMERNCGTPHLAKVTHNPNTLSTLKCANCGSTGSMFKCLGCELTFYCNESCQEQHWLFHGQKCPKKMPKLKKLA